MCKMIFLPLTDGITAGCFFHYDFRAISILGWEYVNPALL